MSRTVTILGAAALKVGTWRRAADALPQTLEHEVLADLVIEAMLEAGLDRREIGSLAFSLPRPYKEQTCFGTFMTNYPRLPRVRFVSEITDSGMTAGLAFEAAANNWRRRLSHALWLCADVLVRNGHSAIYPRIQVLSGRTPYRHCQESFVSVGEPNRAIPHAHPARRRLGATADHGAAWVYTMFLRAATARYVSC